MFDAGISRSLEKSGPRRDGNTPGAPAVPFTTGAVLRMLSYLRPYPLHAIGILACIAAGAAAGLVPPLLIRELIDHALPEGNALMLSLLVGGMIAVDISSCASLAGKRMSRRADSMSRIVGASCSTAKTYEI